MVNEEIVGGLRNALERGYSLDQAVLSFINAGYNPQEVKDASDHLSQGAMSVLHAESKPSPQIQPINTTPIMSNMFQSLAVTSQQPSEKPSFLDYLQQDKGRMILIGGILFSLLIIFGAIGYVLIKYAL